MYRTRHRRGSKQKYHQRLASKRFVYKTKLTKIAAAVITPAAAPPILIAPLELVAEGAVDVEAPVPVVPIVPAAPPVPAPVLVAVELVEEPVVELPPALAAA